MKEERKKITKKKSYSKIPDRYSIFYSRIASGEKMSPAHDRPRCRSGAAKKTPLKT